MGKKLLFYIRYPVIFLSQSSIVSPAQIVLGLGNIPHSKRPALEF